MNEKQFHKILDQIKYSIFKKLDKYGNYARVDESVARDAVETTIRNAKDYFKDEKIPSAY